MKYLKCFLFVALLQYIPVLIFAILNEAQIAFIVNLGFIPILTILFIYLILYFIYRKALATKFQMNHLDFNAFMISMWFVLSIINSFFMISLVDNNILKGYKGWINPGLEYIMLPFIFMLFSIVVLTLALGHLLYNKIRSCYNG